MHWILSQKGEIGMKKIYLLLFLCACITSCGRVNENDMKQISNSTQGTQTNKDRIFSIEDRRSEEHTSNSSHRSQSRMPSSA